MKTVDDVRDFFEELKQQGVNFHPDDNFNNYVNVETGSPLLVRLKPLSSMTSWTKPLKFVRLQALIFTSYALRCSRLGCSNVF